MWYSNSDSEPNYIVVLSEKSLQEIIEYKRRLVKKELNPGLYLNRQIEKLNENGKEITNISIESFIGLLLATKKPKCFACSEITCDGSDWTNIEFSLLGDINIVVPAIVYDNGIWAINDSNFKVHDKPFEAELLFTPGPLFKKSKKFVGEIPEIKEVVISNGQIDQNKYNQLIDRRLACLFCYANENAKSKSIQAIITITGLGCGVFAGKFKGTLGERLNKALQYILEKNSHNYSNIACIYFDPFDECEVESLDFNGVKYRVRPFVKSGKPQLCIPLDYEEKNDNFSKCKLFKVVAWDHLSYPGNNYFNGRRFTDDGMVGGATNLMEILTGIKGNYKNGHFLPPKGWKTWKEVVEKKNIGLIANGNVKVVTNAGIYLTLSEYENST